MPFEISNSWPIKYGYLRLFATNAFSCHIVVNEKMNRLISVDARDLGRDNITINFSTLTTNCGKSIQQVPVIAQECLLVVFFSVHSWRGVELGLLVFMKVYNTWHSQPRLTRCQLQGIDHGMMQILIKACLLDSKSLDGSPI